MEGDQSKTSTDEIVVPAADKPNVTSRLPKSLTGDPRRQATPSIRGTVYQAWRSIDAWLRLIDDSCVIYLEGAEDFDLVRESDAIAVQVRNTQNSVSLASQKALQALEDFWKLTTAEGARRVEFHYLTTSAKARESDAEFNGRVGIDAWRIAQTDATMTAKLASYLIAKLGVASQLSRFLKENSTEIIQDRLIRRFHWMMNEPDLDAIKRSVDDRIETILAGQNRPASLVRPVRVAIESRFWEIIVANDAADRQLTRRDLAAQIAASTHTQIPIPLELLPALLAAARPGHGLLELLLQKVPVPPTPLLHRPALEDRICLLVQQRKYVLITGSVYKGKTTLAQLAASKLCVGAWWLNLTDRTMRDVDNLFLALSERIEDKAAPSLTIIDDLNVGQGAYRTYRTSLQLLLKRAHGAGRGVIFTAQGGTESSSLMQDFSELELLEVEPLDEQELTALCKSYGCPLDHANAWGLFIQASTTGHPKLAQVRIQELMNQGWPAPKLDDFIKPSAAVVSARQMARELLRDTVEPPVAELLYTIAESSVPLHNSVAVLLAETVSNLHPGGDVISRLVGRWLEAVDDSRFRVTALLGNVGTEVWSHAKRQSVHATLHDALSTRNPLRPDEAAAILFHAYLSNDQRRIALSTLKLHLVDEPEAIKQVNRNLQWLTWVALEPGQKIAASAEAASILRSMQFRVGMTLESEALEKICDRWAEEIASIEEGEYKEMVRSVRSISVGFTMHPIPLRCRLSAIADAQFIPAEVAGRVSLPPELIGANSENISPLEGMLACAVRSVREYSSLRELVTWIDAEATPVVRANLDSVLEWPVVQTLGAFVQSAWTGVHEQVEDWTQWLELFQEVEDIALRHNMPRLGREGAKARALVLTEYVGRPDEALAHLDHAVQIFGDSPVLLEQRANVFFQSKDDEAVLQVWSRLSAEGAASDLDPFAIRRVAISAARLGRFVESRDLFLAAAAACDVRSEQPTNFGLQVDAAYVQAMDGDHCKSANLLVHALDSLHAPASADGNQRWEAALRVASEVCRFVANRASNRVTSVAIEFGWASSADLAVTTATHGQDARAELFRAEVLRLSTSVCVNSEATINAVAPLLHSKYIGVRFFAVEARIQMELARRPSRQFIEILVLFARTLRGLAERRRLGIGLLEADASAPPSIDAQPELLHSLLVAGCICAGDNLTDRLSNWASSSSEQLGESSALVGNIRALLDGAEISAELLETTTRDQSKAGPTRIGAALRLLLEKPSADKTIQLQVFILHSMTNPIGLLHQELWNGYVARQFATAWRELAENKFQFTAPSVNVPALLAAIDQINDGPAGLKSLFTAAHNSLGRAPPSFLEKLA